MTVSNLRIVSMIPSATEIVVALGLTDAIVGRSHECDYPPEIQNLPVCTQARLDSNQPSAAIDNSVNDLLKSALSIYDIKVDVLKQLQPTHILTQDQCDVCAVSLADVEKAVAQLTNSQPQIISLHPNVLADIWTDIETVAHALNTDANRLIEDLQARVKICEQKTQALMETKQPTVACIEWTDPLMLAGNWIPEMVTIVGGQPLSVVSGQASQKFAWESLISANPDIIIFMPCGFNLDRTRQEAQLLAQRPEWENLRAVQTGRVYITDGNWYFNRPGSRLVDSVEILAEILHNEVFSYGYEGKAWQHF